MSLLTRMVLEKLAAAAKPSEGGQLRADPRKTALTHSMVTGKPSAPVNKSSRGARFAENPRRVLATVNMSKMRKMSKTRKEDSGTKAVASAAPKSTWQSRAAQRSGGNVALQNKWKAQWRAKQRARAAKKGGTPTQYYDAGKTPMTIASGKSGVEMAGKARDIKRSSKRPANWVTSERASQIKKARRAQARNPRTPRLAVGPVGAEIDNPGQWMPGK